MRSVVVVVECSSASDCQVPSQSQMVVHHRMLELRFVKQRFTPPEACPSLGHPAGCWASEVRESSMYIILEGLGCLLVAAPVRFNTITGLGYRLSFPLNGFLSGKLD